jgi:peptidyl-prolyl cis-trans isomerase A (cyclophilin A)
MKNALIVLSFVGTVLFGCNGCSDKKQTSSATDYNQVQQDLIDESKKQHQKEIKAIKKFIKEKDWPMQETKTGLQYWIYEKGAGQQGALNKIATISYTITLLDGTECYTASDNNPKQFKIGQDNVESGLHEAVQLMHVGDRGRFVLPSHLAFGFTGDSGKIPQNASVVYDIHLLMIQ